jgi:hypothetical protein
MKRCVAILIACCNARKDIAGNGYFRNECHGLEECVRLRLAVKDALEIRAYVKIFLKYTIKLRIDSLFR